MSWLRLLQAWAGVNTPAVVAPDGTWSGAELLGAAASAAAWLDDIGAPVGAPVPALVGSSRAGLALAVAGAATGRPIAPLPVRHTLPEVAACVDALGGGLIVADADGAQTATGVADLLGRGVAVTDGFRPGSSELSLDAPPEAPVFVLHTSGTSGRPKPVPVRNDRLGTRSRVSGRLVALGPDAVFASASPFHHLAGLGQHAVVLASRATAVVVPRFNVESWRSLSDLGTTNAVLVPTMIDTLLQVGALADVSTLRVLQYGTAPIHPETLVALLGALPEVEVKQIFGQTEGSPITCLTGDDHRRALVDRPAWLESVGRAVDGVDLRIAGAGADGIGEVWARADHLFAPAEDGWLHTGDLGRLDDEGYLFLVGRQSDTIIRGGENIQPAEVERAVRAHPAVDDVAVVGLPDRHWGEVPVAFVVLATDAGASADELNALARGCLARFKVPEQWIFVPDLPRGSTGKVLRRQLRDSMVGDR